MSRFSALYKTMDDINEIVVPASRAKGTDNPNKAVGIVVAPVEKKDIFRRLLANHFMPAPFRHRFKSL